MNPIKKDIKVINLTQLKILSDYFYNMGDYLDRALPEGRPKALTMTKLEESFLWAKEALAKEVKDEEAEA